MIKQFVFIIIISLSSFLSYGQTHSTYFKSDYYSNLSPKKPETAALGSYGNIPVNYYTGRPEVSLNLLTLTGRETNLPLALNYDASGIRADEVSGSFGLKWHANFGGFISRRMAGLPDEDHTKGYWKNANSTNYWSNVSNIDSWAVANEKNENDTAPDEFTININGRSITFYFDKSGKAFTVPRQNIKITYLTQINSNSSQMNITQFQVTMEDGTQYTFGGDPSSIEESWYEHLTMKFKMGDYDADASVYEHLTYQQSYTNEYDHVFLLRNSLPSNYSNTVENEEKKFSVHNSKWYLRKIISPVGEQTTFFYEKDAANLVYTSRPFWFRVEQVKLVIDNYTWTKRYCPNPTVLGCYGDRADRTETRQNLPAIAKFPKTMPGSPPTSYSLGIPGPWIPSTIESNTSAYFWPDQYTAAPPSLQITHGLTTQSNIRLKEVITSTGNKVTFEYLPKEDLPNSFKVDKITLYNMLGKAVRVFRFKYSLIDAMGITDDLWRSENIMKLGISSSLPLTNANQVTQNLPESSITNSQYKKFIFEGLKRYNYYRVFLSEIEEVTNNTSTSLYKFQYNSPELLRRRTTSTPNTYGYTAAANIGLLKRLEYPTAGFTEFTFSAGISPKVTLVRDFTETNSLISQKEMEYKSFAVVTAPVTTSYQETKMHETNDWIKYSITSNIPQNEFEYTQGAVEGNKEVFVYNGTKTAHRGYEIFKYQSPVDNSFKDIPTMVKSNPVDEYEGGLLTNGTTNIFPFPQAQNKDYLRGLMTSHEVKDSLGNTVRQVKYQYDVNPYGYVPTEIKGLKGGTFPFGITEKRSFMYGKQTTQNYKYRHGIYKIVADWVVLTKTEDINYESTFPVASSKFATKVTEFTYDPISLQQSESRSYNAVEPSEYVASRSKYPTHPDYNFYPTNPINCEAEYTNCNEICNQEIDPQVRSSCYNSCNQSYSICESSPGSSPSAELAAINELRNRHQINTPIEITQLVSSGSVVELVNSSFTLFEIGGTSLVKFVKPKHVYTTNQARPLNAYLGSYAATNGTIVRDPLLKWRHTFIYDLAGNLIRQESQEGISSTYQWGYNNSLVTGYIINPGAFQHTVAFSHIPLVGVDVTTDENGITNKFTYDRLNRLKLIRDHSNGIVNRYYYNSKRSSLNRVDFNYVTLLDNSIEFTSFGAEEPGTSLTWDFGKGTIKNNGNVKEIQTYPTPGSYRVKLVSNHPEHPPSIKTRQITILQPVNIAITNPTIAQSLSVCLNVGPVTVPFQATIPGGLIYTFNYQWQYRGGSSSAWFNTGSNSNTLNFVFNSNLAPSISVRCLVSDNLGNSRYSNSMIVFSYCTTGGGGGGSCPSGQVWNSVTQSCDTVGSPCGGPGSGCFLSSIGECVCP
jgi:hypothetical protein